MSEEKVCKTCGVDLTASEDSVDKEENQVSKVDFKVYDVPVELKNKYVSMAKLDYDNDVWKVLEAGMKKLNEERQNKVPQLEEKIESLEKQVLYLNSQIENIQSKDQSNEKEDSPSTFGGQPEEDGEEVLDKFGI